MSNVLMMVSVKDNSKINYCTLILLLFVRFCDTWRAVPANQAMYALRSDDSGYEEVDEFYGRDIADERLPRDTLNSMYKFGWCSRDMVLPVYFRKSVNITFTTWATTQVNYIYLLMRKNTQQYTHQCIVLKMYVPAKYKFYKTRLPLYYCQGTVHFLMMNTINKYEVHEFYLKNRLLAPANFVVEFYHGKPY